MKKLLLPALLLLLLAAACDEEKVRPEVDASLNADELPTQESYNSTLFFSDSGVTRAVMDFGRARMYRQAQETLVDSGLKIRFYNADEIKTAVLTSKRGRVDDRTQDLFAYEDVVVVNDSGTVVETEELMFRNKDKKIVSDKAVKITTPDEVIKGVGFESDQSLSNYTIFQPDIKNANAAQR